MSDIPESKAKRGEELAAAIARDIIDGGWQVSQLLGTEADLTQRHQVSRAIFREAVRILEHRMVARMKSGPGGGLIVTEPQQRIVWDIVDLYLESRRVSTQHIFETRAALELTAVDMATRRISASGIQKLRERVVSEMETQAKLTPDDDVAQFDAQMSDGDEFHSLIGELTGNPALHIFIRTLAELTWQRYRQRVDHKVIAPGHGVGSDHVGIAEAVMSGDTALARVRMLEHLQGMAQLLGLEDFSPS